MANKLKLQHLGIFAVLLIAVLFDATCSAYTESRLMTYVQSKKFGNFMKAPGTKMSSVQATMVVNTTSVCQCRNICFVQRDCTSFSIVESTDDTKECYITTLNPWQTIFAEDYSAATYYRESAIKPLFIKRMDDGHLYYIPSFSKSFVNSKKFCLRIPGFQLAIFKSYFEFQALANIMKEVERSLYIDLSDTTGRILWGDGTQLSKSLASEAGLHVGGDLENEEYAYAISRVGLLFDYNDTSSLKFLCQARNIYFYI